ncbi:hypothetical protein [Aureibacter tunicatorum]|uniref:RNA-binding protein YhbY n=1 Tax=Aureibacter tunicatorum TaxID=866807 RepID=A0AAE4BRN3_9BACT|nr:hypothetical protein [Aureibacter tunicatorum]MDR6240384.1 RNA-binding protein YhbY [Aureibacter tunicatorum]
MNIETTLNIDHNLKEMIFSTAVGDLSFTYFEHWLLNQSQYHNLIAEDLFFLNLYSMDYQDKGIQEEFEKTILEHLDQNEFELFKIKHILNKITEDESQIERLLQVCLDWKNNDMEWIKRFGYHLYDFSEYEFYGYSKKELINKIQREAKDLLSALQDDNHIHKNIEFRPNRFTTIRPKSIKIKILNRRRKRRKSVLERLRNMLNR